MTTSANAQTINAGQSALILIETQNEWMHPEGKLRKGLIVDEAMTLDSITNIATALNYARKNGITVVYVGLNFAKGYPELGKGGSGLRKVIPQAGTFQKGSFGAGFYESVKPLDDEFIAGGRTGASAFSGSNLDVFLRSNKIENLYLVGYASHVCVESTLRDAHDKGYHTSVISDATAAFTRAQQDYFLKEIVHHFGEQLTTKEFINE